MIVAVQDNYLNRATFSEDLLSVLCHGLVLRSADETATLFQDVPVSIRATWRFGVTLQPGLSPKPAKCYQILKFCIPFLCCALRTFLCDCRWERLSWCIPFGWSRWTVWLHTMFLIPKGCFTNTAMASNFEQYINIHELAKFTQFNLTCHRKVPKGWAAVV